jgi:hypothetical protein
VPLHDCQELDNDLGARPDQDLSLSSLLGVVDGVQRIVKNRSLDHFGGVAVEILKSLEWMGNEVSVRVSELASRSHEHGECPHGRNDLHQSPSSIEGSARSVLERRRVSGSPYPCRDKP